MSERMNHAASETGAIRFPAHLPSLSVVLLSEGTPEELERALASIGERCRSLSAEVIVVRRAMGEGVAELSAAHPGVVFLEAPVGSSSAEMREIGVHCASGDILAMRTDGAVGDGCWLQAFESTVGVTPAALAPREVARNIAPVVDDAIAARERRAASITRPLSVTTAETSGLRDRLQPGSAGTVGTVALAWPNARRVT